MFTRFLKFARERIHPLHYLRRNRLVATKVLARLDRPVARKLHGVDWPVWLRRVRHATYIADSRIVEPGELALFAVLCRAYQLRVLWDVGANIGLYSWLFLSSNPDNAAVLFEPDPDNLLLIDRTIEDNRLDRATVRRCAVSDNEGKGAFTVDVATGHTGHLVTSLASAGGTIEVPLVTLDQVARDIPPPDIIKIDVEGAEPQVVAGATVLLNDHQPIILFECFAGSEAATALLGPADYKLFNAEDPDGSIEETVNFLALPNDKAGDMEQRRAEWRDEIRARGL